MKPDFKPQELVVAVIFSLVIFAIYFVAASPLNQFNQQNTNQHKQNIQLLAKALNSYIAQNSNYLPTYSGSNTLPTVTSENAAATGVNIEELDGFFGEYVKSLPQALSQKYKVGVLSGGDLILATYLADNTPYTQIVE